MLDRFPRIGQFRDFTRELTKLRRTSPDTVLSSYTLTGTVKLHGTHADIVVDKTSDGELVYRYQSRNRVLSIEQDNLGFVHFMSMIPRDRLDSLVRQIEDVYTTTQGSPPEYPILIAGEFCGDSIQANVALSQLPKMFVLYNIKIESTWQSMKPYSQVQLEDHRIYNISRGQTFHVTMSAKSMHEVVPTLQSLTLDVERECPFAKSLGVVGVGEGVVWVCEELVQHSDCWFKVKGEKHSVSRVTTLKDISPEMKAMLKSGSLFADQAVTEARLLQGVDYLREMMLPITMASFPVYMRWLFKDVLEEEKDAIEAVGIEPKTLTKSIVEKARPWFQNHCETLRKA